MASPGPTPNFIQVPDYERYLVAERRSLTTRYLCVERDLAGKKLEYAQTLSDEKRTKAAAWERAIQSGVSATGADKAADHAAVHVVTESILLRADVDVLEREAAMLLFLLKNVV